MNRIESRSQRIVNLVRWHSLRVQNERKKNITERERISVHVIVPPFIEGATLPYTLMRRTTTPLTLNRWRAFTEDSDDTDDDEFTAEDIKKLDEILRSVPLIQKLNDTLDGLQNEIKKVVEHLTYGYNHIRDSLEHLTLQSMNKSSDPLSSATGQETGL